MFRKRYMPVLLIMCLLTGLVYFTISTNGLKNQQAIIQEQLDASDTMYEMLNDPPSDTQERMDQALLLQQKEIDGISAELSSTEAINELIELAEKHKLKLGTITTGQRNERNVGNSIYSTQSISLMMEGQQSDVLAFVKEVEDQNIYPYWEIEYSQLYQLDNSDKSSEMSDIVFTIRITIIEKSI